MMTIRNRWIYSWLLGAWISLFVSGIQADPAAVAAPDVENNIVISVYRLTVTKTGTGQGTVTSNPTGINCGGTCKFDYVQGNFVKLTATASPNSSFTGWSGACTGTIATCQVTMAAAKTVTASFGLNTPGQVITYFHNDALGSPIMATDETGKIIWREEYQPYGKRIIQQDTRTGKPYQGYTGKPEQTSTGLIYFGSRWYNPAIGRFYSIDPQGFDEANPQSFNRYAYGNNNPYRFVDPNGEWAIPAIIVGVASYLGGMGADAISQYAAFGQVDWAGAATSDTAIGAGLEGVFSFSGIGALKAAAKRGLSEANAARDALAESLAPLKGKAPATVTGGYNIKTGEVAAKACGGGKCAEDHVLDALGGAKSEVRFTKAVRPRTGAEVPVCARCEASYGRKPFPPGTRFKTDE